MGFGVVERYLRLMLTIKKLVQFHHYHHQQPQQQQQLVLVLVVLDLDFNPSGNKEKEKEKEKDSGSGSAASSSSSAEAKRDPGAKAPKEAETSNTIEPWLQHAMGQGWDMDKTVSKGSYKFFNTSTEQVDGRKLIVSVHVFSTRGKFWLRKGWGFKFTKNNQKGVRSAGKSTKRDNSREYFLVQVEKDFTRNGDVVGVLYDVQEDTCFRARVANLTPGVGTVPNPEKMLLRAKNGNVTSQIPPNQSKSGGKKQPSKRKHESKKSNAPKKMKLSDPPPLRADPPRPRQRPQSQRSRIARIVVAIRTHRTRQKRKRLLPHRRPRVQQRIHHQPRQRLSSPQYPICFAPPPAIRALLPLQILHPPAHRAGR